MLDFIENILKPIKHSENPEKYDSLFQINT